MANADFRERPAGEEGRGRDDEVWTYNPDASEKLAPGMTLVVLGSAEQVSELLELRLLPLGPVEDEPWERVAERIAPATELDPVR